MALWSLFETVHLRHHIGNSVHTAVIALYISGVDCSKNGVDPSVWV